MGLQQTESVDPQDRCLRYAQFAMLLWLCSLPLTAMRVNYYDISGGIFLLFGWLGFGGYSFAWFANLFFLMAFVQMMRGKQAFLWSCVALCLALSTFLLTEWSKVQNLGLGNFYGYGWGFILWLAATFLMLAGAARRKRERIVAARFLELVSVFLCLGVLLGSMVLGLYDRSRASAEELRNLQSIAFKRLPVCTLENEPVAEPMHDFSGVLQVRLLQPPVRNYFISPRWLLRQGISAVQMGDREFRYRSLPDGSCLLSYTQVGVPAVTILEATEHTGDDGSRVLSMRLTDAESGRLTLDRQWVTPKGDWLSCPAIEEHVAVESVPVNYPRNLLRDTLLLQAVPVCNSGRINDYPQRAMVSYARSVNYQKGVESPGRVTPLLSGGEPLPSGVGWDETLGRDGVRVPGNGFQTGRVAYILNRSIDGFVYSPPYVYFYEQYLGMDSYQLVIHKRRLDNFQRLWSRKVLYALPRDEEVHPQLRLEKLQEGRDGRLRLTGVFVGSGSRITLQTAATNDVSVAPYSSRLH